MLARLAFASIFALFGAFALGACGSEIGDSCVLSSDCDPNGGRTCDVTSPDGYCTIAGCDVDTCPSEAVCVRFFVGTFSNKACDPATEDRQDSSGTDDCSLDEVCTLGGTCAPSSAEVRYCMRTCGGDGDCRSGYECRDEAAMIAHGGEPVRAAGEPPPSDPQPFCAVAPAAP